MLKNYLTIALRNLRKQKAYSFINVAGLAIGLACCLLIVRYIQDEQSYDRFHENADRIYRVVAGFEDGPPTNANNGFSWGPTIEKDFPEVEYMARLHKMGWGEERVVARGDQRFYEDSFFFADPDIFQIFSFPFVAGDPATALVEPNTVVITESMAQKYLPGEDALGKMISADPYNDGQFIDFTITGVMEDIPENSHVHFDFLASVATEGELAGWGFDPVFTYMLLAEGADPSDMEARFPDMLASHIPADRLAQFPLTLHLQPLTDIRLHSNLRAELEPTGDIAYVYLFSAIGLLILVIACINFMNLATARSAQRAREVGMRKVLGAARPQLIRQFLGEALLLSGLALVLAMALIQVALPVFNSLSGKAISINYLDNLALLGSLVGLTLLVGVVAGSYPAFFLSAFRPSEVLKGQTRHGRSRAVALRKGLVVFQFAISIFLIASTAVVYQQMQYIRAKNLGFDREQIVVLPLNDEVRASYETMRNTLLQDTGIQAIALSEQVPARAGSGSRYTIEGIDEPVSAYRLFTDHTFLNTYGMNLVAGRGFSEAVPTDSTDAFIINEAFVREQGWDSPEDALGRSISMRWSNIDRSGQIVGVAKDFHLFSLRDELEGTVVSIMPDKYLSFVSVRLAPGRPSAALDRLASVWATVAPSYPFDYYFLDQDFDRLHRADAQLGQVFFVFAFLAILVACLGLFGLAAFTAEQRTKEIGVRKVLGATIPNIAVLLSKDFALLVGLAFVLAAPLAYFAMSGWLNDFVYRIDLGVGTFVLAGVLALGIALLTVSYQAIRAALADPVKSLRYE